MIASYRRISTATLQRLRENPDQVEEFVVSGIRAGVGGGIGLEKAFLAMVDQLPEEQRHIAQARMQSLKKLERLVQPQVRSAGIRPDPHAPLPLDIGKAWRGLHRVLCGVAEDAPPPLGNVVRGGEPLGPDVGFGPCRFLTPEQVTEAARALSGISVEAFRERSGRWESDAENRDWLADAFVQVSAYFREASAAGDAMLLYLT
jgi:hypothetical protein